MCFLYNWILHQYGQLLTEGKSVQKGKHARNDPVFHSKKVRNLQNEVEAQEIVFLTMKTRSVYAYFDDSQLMNWNFFDFIRIRRQDTSWSALVISIIRKNAD